MRKCETCCKIKLAASGVSFFCSCLNILQNSLINRIARSVKYKHNRVNKQIIAQTNGAIQFSLGHQVGYQISKNILMDGSYAHAFIQNENVYITTEQYFINGANRGDGIAISLCALVIMPIAVSKSKTGSLLITRFYFQFAMVS